MGGSDDGVNYEFVRNVREAGGLLYRWDFGER